MSAGIDRVRAALGENDPRRSMAQWLESSSDTSSAAFAQFYRDIMTHGRVNPAEARELLRRLRRHWNRHLDRHDRARLQRLNAHTLHMIGEMAKASTEYEMAVEAFEDLGDRLEVGRTTVGWLDVLAFCGDYARARSVVERGREALRGLDRVTTARLESNWGNALYLSGQLREAAATFRKSRRQLLAAGLARDAALIEWNLGQVLLMQGQVKRARKHFIAAEGVFTQRGFESSALRCRFGLAAADLLDGDWSEATGAFESLQSEFERIGDHRATAATQWELSRFLGAVGAKASAVRVGELARNGFRRLGLRRDAIEVSRLLGRWQLDRGEPRDARARLLEVLDYYQSVDDTRSALRVRIELAESSIELQRVDEALATLKSCARAVAMMGDRSISASYFRVRARAQLARERFDLAARHGERAYDLARDYPQKLDRPRLAMVCARAHTLAGSEQQAWRWIRRATRLADRLYEDIGITGLRTEVSESRKRVYREAVDLLLENPDMARGKQVLDLLGRSLSTQLVEAILREEPDLDRALEAAVARMRNSLLAPEGGPGGDVRYRNTRQELQELEEAARHVRRRSRRLSKRRLRQWSVDQNSRQWRARLKTGRLLLFDQGEMPNGESGHRVYVVEGRAAIRVVDLPELSAALEGPWSSFRMICETAAHLPQRRRAAFLRRTRAEADACLVELRRAIFDPLELDDDQDTRSNPDTRVLHVVASPALQPLPLEALLKLRPEGGRWTLLRWAHPALLREDSHVLAVGKAMLLSDGRSSTSAECAQVAACLRKAHLRTRRIRRCRNFARMDERLKLLHVAAHGVHHPEQWILNGLCLEDGWLGLESLDPRQLEGALLVLSSCESGLLSNSREAETNGWVIAALRAQARAMVSTLWKIDDTAAQAFAREFYARLVEGMPVARAVAEAQAALRRRHPHPFHWASHMSMG